MTEYPAVEDRGDMVILRGDLGSDIVWGVQWPETEHLAEFEELFQVDDTDYLGDPDDSFYQGVTLTRIIRRKSDGRMFGFEYSDAPGIDGWEGSDEQDWEALIGNLPYDDELGDVAGGTPYVFLPVEPFTRTGYRVIVQEKVAQ